MTTLALDPTHHTANSHTLIDLIIVSDPSEVSNVGQLPVPGISRHDLIYCILTVKSPKPSTQFITFRNIKNIDEISFYTDVQSTSWESIHELKSVDEIVDTLNSMVVTLYDKYALIFKKRVGKNA